MSVDVIQEELRELELLDGQMEADLDKSDVAEDEETLEDFDDIELSRAHACMNHGTSIDARSV